MSIWIKICANTSLADAMLAADAGADAVGFVFAPSKRRVTAEQVAAIVPHLPQGTEKIGVFAEAPFEEIAATTAASGLTGIQLHFEAQPALIADLRRHFGPGMRIIRTVHFVLGGPAPSLEAVEADPNIDAILIDSKVGAETGGTGQAFDWELAATSLFQNAKVHKHRITAGGLTPENVAKAIRILKPWGVDVASGVEAEPGRKDAGKVCGFIANARNSWGTTAIH